MTGLDKEKVYEGRVDSLYVEFWNGEWTLGVSAPGLTSEHTISRRLAEQLVDDHMEEGWE